MKKKILSAAFILACFALLSCGSKKETAASIAQKWCDLNAKAYKAAEGAEKEAAEKARSAFENEIEAKYKGDEAFMKEVETEVEKCEDASEGRK
jgi:esterase/lipase